MISLVRNSSMAFLLFFSIASSQPFHRDTAFFPQSKNEFWDSIETSLQHFYQKETKPERRLVPDFSLFNAPKTNSEFTSAWHTPPVSQANSGMCWCFSTTSFLESEAFRLHKKQLKLSELYTVYWEYVEKAKGYVRTRGNQSLGEGSQGGAVLLAWQNHGIVPEEAYTGLLNGQPFHDHSKLFLEFQSYLQSVKASNAWDEETVVHTVQSILNHFLGVPPETIIVDGKTMTPKEYLAKVVKIHPDEYIAVVSFLDRPTNEWTEYDVPDNWRHSKEFFNVPLSVFMGSLKQAIRNGYTMEIWGDVSEPGLEGHAGIAVIPSFDIPSQYIDENARIFRYKNGTTGDDHGIHLVGYTERDGHDWYLIKDSGSGSRNNSHRGYYYYSEDYVKLKMLGFLIHKDAVPEIVSHIKTQPPEPATK